MKAWTQRHRTLAALIGTIVGLFLLRFVGIETFGLWFMAGVAWAIYGLILLVKAVTRKAVKHG